MAARQHWTVTRQTILAYAELSGDFNPLHVDEEYGSQTEFGRCIAHGPIALNVFFSEQFGEEGWREGVQVSTKYIAPVGSGDGVTWRWVSESESDFEVVNADGTPVIVGSMT